MRGLGNYSIILSSIIDSLLLNQKMHPVSMLTWSYYCYQSVRLPSQILAMTLHHLIKHRGEAAISELCSVCQLTAFQWNLPFLLENCSTHITLGAEQRLNPTALTFPEISYWNVHPEAELRINTIYRANYFKNNKQAHCRSAGGMPQNNHCLKKNTFRRKLLDCTQDPTFVCLFFYPYTISHAFTHYSIWTSVLISPQSLSCVLLQQTWGSSGCEGPKDPAEGKSRDLRTMWEKVKHNKGFWALTSAEQSGNHPASLLCSPAVRF